MDGGAARLSAIAVVFTIAAACGSGASETGDPAWATEVDAVVADLAEAYETQDLYQTARFFSAGGTLDLSVWELGVATSPDEVVETLGELWHQADGGAAVEPWHVFVSPDQALVSWGAYEAEGFQRWAQSYAFGPTGRTASRTFRALEFPFDEYREGEAELTAFVDRYIAAWNGGGTLQEVYASNAIVRDDVAGTLWRGIDEVVQQLDTSPPLEHGPWPEIFVYRDQADQPPSEAIVIFQLEGACPSLEARRWVLVGGQISNEVRLAHVPSARRCGSDLPDGWWTTFELPPELLSNVTEVLDVGGNSVMLINAEPGQEAFARWLFDRYRVGEVGVPEVAAIWFPPAPECIDQEGLATSSDERYQGRRTAVVCFGEDRLGDDETPSGWSRYAASIGLHELGHIWLFDRLGDETREEFTEAVDLLTWNDREVRWSRRAVEHAAFTLAWGLAGDGDAQYTTPPRPACGDAAARFELLTGQEPVTTCDDPEATL